MLSSKVTPAIPLYPPESEPTNIKSNITSANCPCANESAQSLKYEAVLETVPRTY